jgi:hypothetical protein
VSEAKVIYPSDKPIVFAFNDFNGFNYQIEVKKIVNKWTLREHFAVMVHYQ